MPKIKITMVMSDRPQYPADDLPALRQNVFELLNRMREQLTDLLARFEKDSRTDRTMGPEFQRAVRTAFGADLDAVAELVASFEVEVVG